jgi:hypothetical protein
LLEGFQVVEVKPDAARQVSRIIARLHTASRCVPLLDLALTGCHPCRRHVPL